MTEYNVYIINYAHDKESFTRVRRVSGSPFEAARDRCDMLTSNASGLSHADRFPVLVTWTSDGTPHAELFELNRVTEPRWEVSLP
jgi:hypothetical protein